MSASKIETHTRHMQLQKTSVEEIEKSYTAGEITYAQRKSLLVEKALQVNKDAFGDQGYVHAIYKKTLAEIEKGVENLKEAATWTEGETTSVIPINIRQEAYHMGLGAWGMIQILNAIPTAFGEVTGLVNERIALQNGADPTTAKLIGIVTDLGSNFIPAAGIARTSVAGLKGVQAAVKGASKSVAKDPKMIREVVEEALDVSLKRGGVEQTVFSKVEKLAETAQDVKPPKPPSTEYVKKGHTIVSPSGRVINTETGEVLLNVLDTPALPKVGAEFMASGMRVRVSSVKTAEEIAAKKLGVPKEQVSDMLTGWAPEAMAKGNVEEAAGSFIREMEQSGVDIENQIKKMMGDVLNEKGSMTIPSWGQVSELYRNLLLAGPVGRTRDFVSNIASTGLGMAQRTVGAMVGGGDTTVMGSVWFSKGMASALHETWGSAALQSAKSPFKTGGMTGASRFDQPLDIKGAWWTNIPTMAVVGMDRGFKTLNRRAHLYAQEFEDAAHHGRAFDIQNVNLPTAQRWEKATQYADYVTFQNDVGAIGKMLTKGVQATRIGELYFPFMKTPINLMKYSWNNTPGLQLASGRLWDEIKAGGEAADMAMGRLTISNMFGFYISELVKAGMITGSGPADPALRAAWISNGNVPYSVRVGDTWVPYNFWGPLAQTVGMVADYTQIMDSLDTPSAEQGGLAILMSIERNIGESSWFGNLEKMMDAVRTLGKNDQQIQKMYDVAAHPFVTMLSGGSAGGTARRFLDPVSREAHGFIEELQSRTPGWSKTAPPNLDQYGDVIIPPLAWGGRWVGLVSPVTIKSAAKDRMRMEGDRLKAHLPFFGDSIGGYTHERDLTQTQPGDKLAVGITSQQKYDWKSIYGNTLESHPDLSMNSLMDSEEYKAATDPYKRVLFEGRGRDAKSFATEMLKLKHPKLGKQMEENEARRWLPMVEGQEQIEAARDFQENIDFYDKLTPDEVDNILKYTTED